MRLSNSVRWTCPGEDTGDDAQAELVPPSLEPASTAAEPDCAPRDASNTIVGPHAENALFNPALCTITMLAPRLRKSVREAQAALTGEWLIRPLYSLDRLPLEKNNSLVQRGGNDY